MADVPPNIFHSTQQRFHRAVDPRYNVKAGVTVLHPTPAQERRQSYIGRLVTLQHSATNWQNGVPTHNHAHVHTLRVVEGYYDFNVGSWMYTLVSTDENYVTKTWSEHDLINRLLEMDSIDPDPSNTVAEDGSKPQDFIGDVGEDNYQSMPVPI